MKRILFFLNLALVCMILHAETVYTTGRKPVEVLVLNEMTPSLIAQCNADCAEIFPNVTILAPASQRYNCHSYAWYMTDTTNPSYYWMNPLNSNNSANISKYWVDDHYSETTEANCVKIVYYSSSNTNNDANITHSAVKSAISGYYESKWGSWPLVRHLPNDVPPSYGTTKRYFKVHQIVPSSGWLVCSAGSGTIGRNVSADYIASLPTSVSQRSTCAIVDHKGDDAIDSGSAQVNSTSSTGANITFTKAGVYEIYLRFYSYCGQYIGEYWYEAIVQ